MKKVFYLVAMVLLLCSAGNVNAQSDERFYFPDKEWVGLDGYNYEDIILTEGADTTRSVIIALSGKTMSAGQSSSSTVTLAISQNGLIT